MSLKFWNRASDDLSEIRKFGRKHNDPHDQTENTMIKLWQYHENNVSNLAGE